MFILARAVTYATLFIGFLLVLLPERILSSTGIIQPAAIAGWQIAGIIVGVGGAVVGLSCILTFVFVGKGTPAPFDPPRRLVVKGPYRVIRNPMYVGVGLALTGATLFYQSLPLLGYAGAFFLATHLFVVFYDCSGSLATTTMPIAGGSGAGGRSSHERRSSESGTRKPPAADRLWGHSRCGGCCRRDPRSASRGPKGNWWAEGGW